MQRYEFKVIPAPRRGEKARGVKSTEDRFALALTQIMNEQGSHGWDYVRADALPCDERVGLTGTKTTFQNMLVFRRVLQDGAEQPVTATAQPVVLQADPQPEAAAMFVRAVPAQDGSPLRLGVTAAAPAGAAPPVGPARVAAE